MILQVFFETRMMPPPRIYGNGTLNSGIKYGSSEQTMASLLFELHLQLTYYVMNVRCR